MTDRPDLGPILTALSPYLDSLEIRTERVCMTVSPLTGRRQVRFSRLMAPVECAVEILRDTALDAIEWLNQQPEMTRPIVLEVPPEADVTSALLRLLDAVERLGCDAVAWDLKEAAEAGRKALARCRGY